MVSVWQRATVKLRHDIIDACDDGAVPKLTQPRGVLAVGLALTAAGASVTPFLRDADVLLLLGVTVCVAAAAVAASKPRVAGPNGMPAQMRGTTTAICVLSALVLVPLGAVGVLLIVGTDPLAVFLVGTSLVALAGVLAVVFLVVFFASRWARRRSLESTSSTLSSTAP